MSDKIKKNQRRAKRSEMRITMNGNVKIINYSANASSLVASAGRISTTSGTAGEIYQRSCEKGDEGNNGLIRKILSSGHKSVLEHVNVNLAFDDVSVFVEQFMIEFRLASFTVKSRRYVDFSKMGYYTPDFSGREELADAYRAHMDSLFELYGKLEDAGVPKEDARFVLPYCFKSNFYCTLNARELEKVMSEMVYGRGRAYPELVAIGEELYRQCEEILPYLGREKFSYDAIDETFDRLVDRSAAPLQAAEEKPLMEWIDGTTAPEKVICQTAAAMRGYPADTGKDWEEEQKQELIRALLKGGRKRELEQAHFTFRFNRISLAGVTHLVRHRMQSILVPDYSKVYDFTQYVLPQSIVDAGLAECYENAFRESAKALQKLQTMGLYEKDCVYFMLSGMTIPVVTTMNANELETFMRLRTCNRAQWEIKACADALLEILREKCPVLFRLYGPGCYMLGYCPEGKMTCGRMKELCEKYGKL